MMKNISIALVSAFLVSNASAFVPATQPSTAFRVPSVFGVQKQRLLSTRVMAKKFAFMEQTKTEEQEKITLVASAESSSPVVKEEEKTEAQSLMQKIKDAGAAGIVSYTFWEFAFWIGSIPVVLSAYYGLTGHFPDLSDKDDLAKLGAEAFAFVNVARFAIPLRIGLALSTTPWIQENIMNRFSKKKDEEGVENYDPAEKMRSFE